MTILRLSHVEVRVPDLELATAYYSEVVGLIETARETERVFLKCWDEHQAHSVVLTWEPTHGLNHFGFKVTEPEDLDLYTARLDMAGIEVQRYAVDEWAPGHGEAIRFTLPSGHSMELVHGMQQVGNLLREWEKKHPGRLENMFAALQNIVPSHLMDSKRHDFKNIRTTGVADADGDRAFDAEEFIQPDHPNLSGLSVIGISPQ